MQSNEPPPPQRKAEGPTSRSVVLRGIAGSPGVAVGPAFVVTSTRATFARRQIAPQQVSEERERLRLAVDVARGSVRELMARVSSVSGDYATILEAYLVMLGDPLLHERVEAKIRDRHMCAEWAVAAAAEEIVALFSHAEGDERDGYIAERRHDIEFVADRLLRALTREPHRVIPHLEHPTVVVARDLSPADTACMAREPVIALVTEVGTRTSHTAIMARALEIPAVVGVADALRSVRTGDLVIVDGLRGEITVGPSAEALEQAKIRAERHLAHSRHLLSARDRPSTTACGQLISLKANVELPAEAILALDYGAHGIGLYRTEFLFIDRSDLPDEEEQYGVYRAVVETVNPFPVTLRTFDIGGDKFASTFQLPSEMNPALGLRAVRLALRRPDIFLVQLRAMVRASAHGEVRIMVPMVSSVEELRAVRRLLARAIREVRERGLPHSERISVGAMIEVPSAALMADILAYEADFFSLGTNDLVQYALAVDRTNRQLAPLASPFHPSIVRLIAGVVRAADARKIPCGICGAMASDPLAAPLLVGLGLREMSMEAAAIPEIKETVRRFTVSECEAAAEGALACESAEAVEEHLARTFAPRLYDLLTGEGSAFEA